MSIVQKALSNLRISQKYGIVILFSTVILATISSVVYENISKLSDNMVWVNHTNEVLIEIEQLQSSLKDAETGQRGYLLTGVDSYLDPYQNSVQNVEESFVKLKSLTSDNQNQQKRLSKIKPLIDDKYAELQETIDLRRMQGFEQSLAVVLTDKGKIAMDQLRELLTDMSQEELSLLLSREERTNQAKSETIWVLLFGVCGLIVTVLLLNRVISGNIKRRMNLIISKMADISNGILSNRGIDEDARDEVGILAKSYDKMNTKLVSLISQLELVNKDLVNSVNSLRRNSETLSTNSADQASGIEEISASLEEIVATVNNNSLNASETNKIAKVSQNAALKGNEAVGDALVAANEISAEINVIKEMARQTNLLSLNASVEAARAGEAGRGFAVVAGEVKNLAQRSQDSSTMIVDIVDKSLSVSEQAKKRINEILPNVEKTADLVQQIASASEEQGNGIAQINESMIQLNKVAQENSESSDSVADIADRLSKNVDALTKNVSQYRLEEAAT